MKSITVTIGLLIIVNMSIAQQEKEVYVPKNDVDIENIFKEFNLETRTCGTAVFSVGKHAELVVSETIGDIVVVVLSTNTEGSGMARIRKFYCIRKSDLNLYFNKKSKPEVGILTVPFKFRFSPIKVMAGSTIGPYIGKPFYHDNGTSSTILGFASLTNVPLNDLNEDVPETKWGLGVGVGYVWKVSGNFQTGVISGIDLFEGVETWPYKFQPWVSLSIGYSFTTRQNEEETLRQAR